MISVLKREIKGTEAVDMLKEAHGKSTMKPSALYSRLKRVQKGTGNEWKMKLMRIDLLPCRPMRTFYGFENLCYPIGESLSG